MQLRIEIFIVEQNCVFQDADNKDQQSYHLMGMYSNRLIAYTRLVPPGIIYKECSIGRVITAKNARNMGTGKKLIKKSIDFVYTLFNEGPIKIGAQLYLKRFYESFGFIADGDIYLEDGIEHIHMIKKSNL